MSASKVVVIGLDCVPPDLVFERWQADLPNLSRLAAEGIHGPLASTVPPITVPAWSCMLSSQDPGQLGIYGFRNRADRSYDRMRIADSQMVDRPRVWEIASDAGRQVIVMGVPGTYPPRPVNGLLVSCFLTPDTDHQYTHPPAIGEEISALVGQYLVDVRDFRSEDRARTLADIHEMTEKRFHVFCHFLRTRPWDLAAMVEIGTDRIHHAFWKFMDRQHRDHVPGHRFASAIHDYYVVVDRLVGDVLEAAGASANVMVVSDHGIVRMDGGLCVNDWLAREGLLCFAEPPNGLTPFKDAKIDWARTTAWGDGGYYGRIFLNVRGREPMGTVAPEDFERVAADITERIGRVRLPDGSPMRNRVHRPGSVYREVRRIAPDLLVYWDDLYWRSVGSVGHADIYTYENDTGPDDANHSETGMMIVRPGGGAAMPRRVDDAVIYDIAPTILDLLDLPIPGHMIGRSLLQPSLGGSSHESG